MLFRSIKFFYVFLAGVGVMAWAGAMDCPREATVQGTVLANLPKAKYAFEWYNDGLDVTPKVDSIVLEKTIIDAVAQHRIIAIGVVECFFRALVYLFEVRQICLGSDIEVFLASALSYNASLGNTERL